MLDAYRGQNQAFSPLRVGLTCILHLKGLGVLAQGPRYGPGDSCTCAYDPDRAISSDGTQLGVYTENIESKPAFVAVQQ